MVKQEDYKAIVRKGESLRKSLGEFGKRKQGFFDWQYTSYAKFIQYEFYFNFIPVDGLETITTFISNNAAFTPKLNGGRHDKSDKWQICLKLRIPFKEFSN